MRVAVVGSRTIYDYEWFKGHLKPGIDQYRPMHIVSGGANGVDSMAQRFAKEFGLPITIHYPNWREGNYAGMVRNGRIIADCEVVIAFWDGRSSGTLNTIDRARHADIVLNVIRFDTCRKI